LSGSFRTTAPTPTLMASIAPKVQAQLQRLKVLETAFKEAGLRVRYEKGHFQSGYCLFEDQGVVIVNRFFSPAAKVETLEEITALILKEWSFLQEEDRDRLHRMLEPA